MDIFIFEWWEECNGASVFKMAGCLQGPVFPSGFAHIPYLSSRESCESSLAKAKQDTFRVLLFS